MIDDSFAIVTLHHQRASLLKATEQQLGYSLIYSGLFSRVFCSFRMRLSKSWGPVWSSWLLRLKIVISNVRNYLRRRLRQNSVTRRSAPSFRSWERGNSITTSALTLKNMEFPEANIINFVPGTHWMLFDISKLSWKCLNWCQTHLEWPKRPPWGVSHLSIIYERLILWQEHVADVQTLWNWCWAGKMPKCESNFHILFACSL